MKISAILSKYLTSVNNLDPCIKKGTMYLCAPEIAFMKYLNDVLRTPGWIENSRDISSEIPLSRRELFALIILAHIKNHLDPDKSWKVGYDSHAHEPNDGFITNGIDRLDIEHKVIPQMAEGDPLDNILNTYTKYAEKGGQAYGKNRVLVIQGNQASLGLIRISDLRDKIQGSSPFDRVLFMSAASIKDSGRTSIIHITEQYPNNDTGIAQVDINMIYGISQLTYCQSNFLI